MNDLSSGIVDVDLEGYVEPEVVRGADLMNLYTLRVTDMVAREVETKNGPATLVDFVCRITDSGLVNPKGVRYTLWMPRATDAPDMKNASKGKIIRFKRACGMSEDEARQGGLRKDDFVNAEFQAKLELEESEEYGDRNVIKRVIV